MSGGIDPLLPRDPEGPAEARHRRGVGRRPVAPSESVDVTAMFERHRAGLVRLATAITLDRVLADQIVDESVAATQKQIGSEPDPIAGLHRRIITRAASASRTSRRQLSPRGRRRVASRKPSFERPVFDRPELAATWAAIERLDRRQRAVLVLEGWHHLGEPEIVETVGWPRRTVAANLRAAREAVHRAASDEHDPAVDERVNLTLAVALPQLTGPVPPGPAPVTLATTGAGTGAGTGDADVVDPADSARPAPPPFAGRDATPTGPTSLRLLVPAEPKRHRLVWASAAVVLVAAVVGLVALVSREQGDLLPVTGDTVPDAAGVIAPEWYDVLRPLVPDEFDRLALVELDAERIGYAAIATSTGRLLHITIGRPPVPAALTTLPSSTWTEVPGGWRAVRPDGAVVEVVCGPCGDPATIASSPGPGGTTAPVGTSVDAEDAAESTSAAVATTPAVTVAPGPVSAAPAGPAGPSGRPAGSATSVPGAPGASSTGATPATADVATSATRVTVEGGAPASASVREVAEAIAAGFPLERVDSGFGSPSSRRTDLDAVGRALLDTVPGVAVPLSVRGAPVAPAPPRVTDADADADADGNGDADGNADVDVDVDVEVVEVLAGSPLQSVVSADGAVSAIRVHGVFPIPEETARIGVVPAGRELVGWVVASDGTATGVVTPRRGPTDLGDDVAVARALLDAVAALPTTGP